MGSAILLASRILCDERRSWVEMLNTMVLL
jgi:hypothetical protein